MIIANITSYEGQCSDAEHYYCSYNVVDDKEPDQQYRGNNNSELKRSIRSQKEADYLNDKDGWGRWRIGTKTIKFQTIDQIHKELIKKFPKQTIVTYYKGDLFSDMLYYKDGVNLGYKYFGEVWSNIPTSCWKDLLPDISEIKIKCYDCGKEYKLTDITYEIETEGRTLVKFYKKWEMNNRCCKECDLEWNVIL